MGMGPVPASRMALERAGLSVDDLEVVESNEAFAAQACAVTKTLGLTQTGSIPMAGPCAWPSDRGHRRDPHDQLIHELHRIKGRYGMATMCIGGGQGISIIIDTAI